MPMTFLSGVFYSVQSLPPIWREVSHLNPFFYMTTRIDSPDLDVRADDVLVLRNAGPRGAPGMQRLSKP